MKIYEIVAGEKLYWRENKQRGFWSSFPKWGSDKEDFFILKALVILLSMRLCGIKAHLSGSVKQ